MINVKASSSQPDRGVAMVRYGKPDEQNTLAPHDPPLGTVSLAHALGLNGIVRFLRGYGPISRLRARAGQGIGVISVNESGHHRLIPS